MKGGTRATEEKIRF